LRKVGGAVSVVQLIPQAVATGTWPQSVLRLREHACAWCPISLSHQSGTIVERSNQGRPAGGTAAENSGWEGRTRSAAERRTSFWL
jgi:hypothetical protein